MTHSTTKPLATPVVGGFPEPAESDPMSPAEFRMAREYLGLPAEWIAGQMGVTLRQVRRWEHGHTPVPHARRLWMEELEQAAAQQVHDLAERLRDAHEVVLTVPKEAGQVPASWWLRIAARVSEQVPGVHVRYPDEPRP